MADFSGIDQKFDPSILLMNSRNDFVYHLPEDRIATYPLAQRDASKLLFYKAGKIQHHTFTDLPKLLPDNAMLVFNNSKVISARLIFQKSTGTKVEIFLLEPEKPSPVVAIAMQAQGSAVWNAMVGNKKKWRADEILEMELWHEGQKVHIQASWLNRETNSIRLTWTPESLYFFEVIELFGRIPIPPYLNRETEESDKIRYQTVYASQDGAIAAPTAGLHFTEDVLKALHAKGIAKQEITLHVGAGTFLPVSADKMEDHTMHSEQIFFTLANLKQLAMHDGPVMPVGTTSMRSLESLYWYAAKLHRQKDAAFEIHQFENLELARNFHHSSQEAFRLIYHWMLEKKLESIHGQTGIYILPGYDFKVCRGIITNFHQPGSTLIALIASLIGADWRKVYGEALEKDYRFLSYGDSSLLMP